MPQNPINQQYLLPSTVHHARAISVQTVENLSHIKSFTSTNC